MRARYLLIALAAALLAAGVWLLSRYDTQSEAARPRDERSSQPSSPVEFAPPLAPETPADVDRTPTAVAPQAPLAPAVAPSATPARADIEGTLVLERADGTKDPAPDGRFSLLVCMKEVGVSVDVDVQAGRWAAHFPNELAGRVTRVEFENVRIGDRATVLRAPSEPVAIPVDHPVEVVVGFAPATILRVVDASTGRDLDDVELRWMRDSFMESAHPGLGLDPGQRVLARHKTSPVDVSDLESDREPGIFSLRVHSPGYAWTKITLDTRAGGERVVRLDRGGALRLTLVDNSGSKGFQVRLRHASDGSAPVLSVSADQRSELLLEGLEIGPYSITAELGDWFNNPPKLGEVGAEIVAGLETRATLAVEPAPRAETATAGGVVIVPVEWKLERVMVLLKLLDTPLEGRENYFRLEVEHADTLADGRLAFAWTQPDLQVGRYEFGIFRPPASVVVDLPRDGRTDFRLELAPPAELIVRVVDDVSDEDITTESVLWNPKRPRGVNGGGLENAEFDAATRRFMIRAPEGEIAVSVMGGEFAHRTDLVTLLHGRQEHTLRLRRATSIEIVLRDGEVVLPFPSEWLATVETEDGKPVHFGWSNSTNRRRYGVPSAGRYRFKLPAINGYEPIADQMVDAIEGKTVRLEVALTKTQ